jgi:hypothetical protein
VKINSLRSSCSQSVHSRAIKHRVVNTLVTCIISPSLHNFVKAITHFHSQLHSGTQIKQTALAHNQLRLLNMSSFLTRTARPATTLSRTIAIPASRPFTTTLIQQKTAKDSVKDGLKSVDRAVSDNIVLPGLDAAGTFHSHMPQIFDFAIVIGHRF